MGSYLIFLDYCERLTYFRDGERPASPTDLAAISRAGHRTSRGGCGGTVIIPTETLGAVLGARVDEALVTTKRNKINNVYKKLKCSLAGWNWQRQYSKRLGSHSRDSCDVIR